MTLISATRCRFCGRLDIDDHNPDCPKAPDEPLTDDPASDRGRTDLAEDEMAWAAYGEHPGAAAMTAVPLGQHEPGSEGWEDARRWRLGGSEIAAVLGLSPWESRFSLYLQKKGFIQRSYIDNPLQEWGRRLEPAVRGKFIEGHPGDWRPNPGLFMRSDRSWQLANPDAITDGDLLELKTAPHGDGWGDDGTDEVPVYIRCQILQYVDVFDLDGAWAAVLIRGANYREYRIVRDADAEADIEIIRTAGEEFVTDLINSRTPDIDRHSATLQAVRELHPNILPGQVEIAPDLAGDYLAAVIAEKEAKADKEFHTARILDALGNLRDAVVDGARFAYRTHRSRDGQPGTPFLATDRKRLEQISYPKTIREALGV